MAVTFYCFAPDQSTSADIACAVSAVKTILVKNFDIMNECDAMPNI